MRIPDLAFLMLMSGVIAAVLLLIAAGEGTSPWAFLISATFLSLGWLGAGQNLRIAVHRLYARIWGPKAKATASARIVVPPGPHSAVWLAMRMEVELPRRTDSGPWRFRCLADEDGAVTVELEIHDCPVPRLDRELHKRVTPLLAEADHLVNPDVPIQHRLWVEMDGPNPLPSLEARDPYKPVSDPSAGIAYDIRQSWNRTTVEQTRTTLRIESNHLESMVNNARRRLTGA